MKWKKSLVALLLSVACLFPGCTDQLADSSESSVDSSSIVTEVEETTEAATTEEVTEAETTTEATTTTETTTTTIVTTTTAAPAVETVAFDLNNVPAYSGSPYVAINNNVPYFTDNELTQTSYEYYSPLDSLGRCGVTVACVGQDLMPTEERGEIGSVKPTGWQTIKYDCVDGKYLYNRCHLIGFQLSGENANTQNLITGTRYMNVDGMLPFENMVADYVKETNNHVMYRVTPIFDGNNLVANGVLMEAYSVEDSGSGVMFNVFCYNVQPGVVIDYATGNSSAEQQEVVPDTPQDNGNNNVNQNNNAGGSGGGGTYIINTNTGKFHYPSCSSVNQMNDSNKQEYNGSRDDLIAQGYEPCKRCNP